MSEKKSNIAIGAFVVGAGLILLTLVLFISSGGLRGQAERAVIVFDGSVKGLKVGAPLAFKGVQIGTVTKIDLLIDVDTYEVMMPVEVQYRSDSFKRIGTVEEDENTISELIEKGMRAQLQLQSLLTGLLYIQLDFYPNSKVRLHDINSDLPQFPTIPTDLEKISRNLESFDFGELLANIRNIGAGLDSLVNNPETQALGPELGQTLESVRGLADRLELEIEQASPGLNQLIANTDSAVSAVADAAPEVSEDLQQALKQAAAALHSFDEAMQGVDYAVSDESAAMYELRQAAREVTAAARAMKSLAEALEEQPESIFRGKSQGDD